MIFRKLLVRGSEGLDVIPRCHIDHCCCFYYRFQCDLCEETFNCEDDLENHIKTKHRNQRLVVIALSHRALLRSLSAAVSLLHRNVKLVALKEKSSPW